MNDFYKIVFSQVHRGQRKKYKFVDFDLAYAYEAMPRSYALQSNRKKCEEFEHRAIEASKKIKNDEDKDLFFSDLKVGLWFGCDEFIRDSLKK